MGVVKQSYETVESYLSTLDEAYDSFKVNQTTVAATPDRYERERERASAGSVDLYTKVRNDDGEILHVREDEGVVLPSTRTTSERFERSAFDAVEAQTGVECRVEGIEQATILGIRDESEEHEPVYRLAVVFEATHWSGSADETALWRSNPNQPSLVYG